MLVELKNKVWNSFDHWCEMHDRFSSLTLTFVSTAIWVFSNPTVAVEGKTISYEFVFLRKRKGRFKEIVTSQWHSLHGFRSFYFLSCTSYHLHVSVIFDCNCCTASACECDDCCCASRTACWRELAETTSLRPVEGGMTLLILPLLLEEGGADIERGRWRMRKGDVAQEMNGGEESKRGWICWGGWIAQCLQSAWVPSSFLLLLTLSVRLVSPISSHRAWLNLASSDLIHLVTLTPSWGWIESPLITLITPTNQSHLNQPNRRNIRQHTQHHTRICKWWYSIALRKWVPSLVFEVKTRFCFNNWLRQSVNVKRAAEILTVWTKNSWKLEKRHHLPSNHDVITVDIDCGLLIDSGFGLLT